MSFKVYLALGLALGFVKPPAHAAASAAIDIGAYPLEIDPGELQGDPKERIKQAEKALKRHEQVRTEALKSADGDVGKAMDTLFERCKEPDAAQALFEAMADVAIPVILQSPKPIAGKPISIQAKRDAIYRVNDGESGIAHVARMAQKISGRLNTKDMGHFDAPLLEQAIRLMGQHGALTAEKPTTDGTQIGEVPIDPVVKGTLRGLMGVASLQPFAAKALGQLRDADTAKEIIENPGRYPGASIADYGSDAVAAYKDARMKGLKGQKGGVGGEESFWQSVRLTPKHQDAAIDLALAGDGGAGLAVERNFAVIKMNLNDPDTWFADHLDRWMRFPGTRASSVARFAIEEDLLSWLGDEHPTPEGGMRKT
ncbi:MAG: hypothetical protein Q8O00_05885, partial [Holophaga sp.]|nr:hypothetical protein [Holophaga sp.]